MGHTATMIAFAALMAAAPAISQTSAPAVDATAQAGVAAANRAAAADAGKQANMNAGEQARYAEDRAAYRTALRSHNRNAAIDDRIYDRQQRAYADAMYAWRVQVEDCRRGRKGACKAPTPDPVDYW